jgi:ribonucleoside-diphosphate reductase alpha chain
MMAAAQPFLSGAISKTINMPEESTIEDIMQAYIESWKLGLKAVAIYRDNSKGSQPLSASNESTSAKAERKEKEAAAAKAGEIEAAVAEQRELFIRALRKKLPVERQSITHKFSISGHEGYLTVGMYDDGAPGEIFIKMAKEGSTLSGILDGFALSVSIGLQYGVPMKTLVDKLIHTRFEPSGYTGNPKIPYAKSVLDYLARWLGGHFISADYLTHNGAPAEAAPQAATHAHAAETDGAAHGHATGIPSAHSQVSFDGAPTCSECGMLMTPNGACYKCENCGGTSGCS